MSIEVGRDTERYLRADKLRPGDVLLSRGSGKESAWIARGTFGPYSHVAIYMGNYFIFESIDDGVGRTKLRIVKACRNKGQGRTLLLDVSHYEKLEVRRHPSFEADDPTDIQDALIEILGSSNGREYPSLSALAKTVPFVPPVVVEVILQLVAGRDGIKTVPGLFCSQLVAVALDELHAYPLGNDWLGRKITPERISPNCLRSRRSLLKLVPDVIVGSDFRCEDAMDEDGIGLVSELSSIQEQTYQMVHKGRTQDTLKHVEAISEIIRRWGQPKH